jgi:hypothetical protein
MGYPVVIENTNLRRNYLLFNMCFVFQEDADTSPYESALKKLGSVLRALEVITCHRDCIGDCKGSSIEGDCIGDSVVITDRLLPSYNRISSTMA